MWIIIEETKAYILKHLDIFLSFWNFSSQHEKVMPWKENKSKIRLTIHQVNISKSTKLSVQFSLSESGEENTRIFLMWDLARDFIFGNKKIIRE